MKQENYPVSNSQDILLLLLCSNPSAECYFGQCQECPKTKILDNRMRDVFQKNDIKQICYKQWVSQPKTTLQKASVRTQTFIQDFTKFGEKFLTHSFIASQQAASYKNTKKKSAE